MISLERVVVPSQKIVISLLGTYEKLPFKENPISSVVSETDKHTDTQTSFYFIIRIGYGKLNISRSRLTQQYNDYRFILLI